MSTEVSPSSQAAGAMRGLPGVDAQLSARAMAEATITLAGERAPARVISWSRLAYGVIGLILAAAIWEVGSYLKDDPVILPTVQKTVSTFWHYLFQKYPAVQGKTLWQHALVSAARILAGWAAGVVLGVAMGGVMASVRVIRHLLDPIIEITRPLPPLAFIPLFIVWFGIGETPKFILILIGVVPVMIIATVSALDAVPKELVQASRSLGASPLWALLTVRLRSALPAIITGMRLAMGGAWTSIVAVELIAATSGLGYLINNAGVNLQTPLVLSGILAISVLGIAFDGLLRLLHRFADPTTR
ncbi:ABC transporter permease [Pseudofrankia inefficax]|uniref:Binding-protein-dependent transport systems inner membrane component n=1 Tax=Pseudofrankia inefficax (strain DSM 45817 / CECT 9037 / DDB 130130 / EuI1c) TaxID=298654 RepID=E3JAN4_PSEI1|nr:ABC transporter permease [Pseudofrankia inefficax]ADP82226.1 binding-protein-dependent transport systems inner membrane component [Pseudofrankia inefficax]